MNVVYYRAKIVDRNHPDYQRYGWDEIRVRDHGYTQYLWEEMDEVFEEWQLEILGEAK